MWIWVGHLKSDLEVVCCVWQVSGSQMKRQCTNLRGCASCSPSSAIVPKEASRTPCLPGWASAMKACRARESRTDGQD